MCLHEQNTMEPLWTTKITSDSVKMVGTFTQTRPHLAAECVPFTYHCKCSTQIAIQPHMWHKLYLYISLSETCTVLMTIGEVWDDVDVRSSNIIQVVHRPNLHFRCLQIFSFGLFYCFLSEEMIPFKSSTLQERNETNLACRSFMPLNMDLRLRDLQSEISERCRFWACDSALLTLDWKSNRS